MHHSRLSPVLCTALLTLTLLAACGRAEYAVVSPGSTPTLLPRERSATQIAHFNNERATVSAHSTSFAFGTPYPDNTALPPLPTSPIMTPVPGINGDCANADREFSYVNCWNALIGDEYVFADTVVLKADPLQAVLHVYTATLDLRDIGPMESYSTSIRVGKVRITNVNWPLMTLTALQADPSTIVVFNLEARQWVSPPSNPHPRPFALDVLLARALRRACAHPIAVE